MPGAIARVKSRSGVYSRVNSEGANRPMQQAFIWGLDALLRWGETAAARNIRTVATVGAFDGVHRGHRQILHRLCDQAAQSPDVLSAVIIFEPQPQEYFAPNAQPARLTSLREKVSALHAVGIDIVVCLRFNAKLRSLTALDFVTLVLLQGLRIRHLEIGDDFRFGCDRQGDFAMLQAEGEKQAFTVNSSYTYEREGVRISSTRVRKALAANDFAEAEQLLGRPYSVAGRVVYGRQLGRQLNAPTANILLKHTAALANGVFAATVQIEGSAESQNKAEAQNTNTLLHAVANVGVKPTVNDQNIVSLEVHLFDFSDNLYGKCVRVFFHSYLRPEQKFASLDELKTQILHDCQQAKDYFRA